MVWDIVNLYSQCCYFSFQFEKSFKYKGIVIRWEGEGLDERGINCDNGDLLVKIDKKYYFLNTTLERLRSEGWQYFSLTGRYSGHL